MVNAKTRIKGGGGSTMASTFNTHFNSESLKILVHLLLPRFQLKCIAERPRHPMRQCDNVVIPKSCCFTHCLNF